MAMAVDSGARKTKGFYKPPTRDELQNVKQTANLFGSNLLKLQISELLSEVSPPTAYPGLLAKWLRSVESFFKSLPTTDRVKLCEGLSLLEEDVKYPLLIKPNDPLIKGYFQFYPPKSVSMVGSFLLTTQLKTSRTIDLCLRIPEECLQPKDILNYRYFHKRALFLSLIAGHCKKSKLFESVRFIAGNALLPMVELIPSDPTLTSYLVNIHCSLPSDYFPLHKLYPDRNNVRVDCSPAPPTPVYNSDLLLESGARKEHIGDIYSAIHDCPSIREAIILYRVWAKQRDFHNKFGCFSAFHFSMLLFYLLKKSKITTEMSCSQVFTVGLKFIADTDLTTNGISLMDRKQYPTLPSLQLYHSHYEVVFIDGRGLLNLCSHMTREHFRCIRDEARLSLNAAFESLFMKPVPMLLKYDGLIKVDLSGIPLDDEGLSLECDLRGQRGVPLIIKRIIRVIKNGLKSRIEDIVLDGYPIVKWDISADSVQSNTSIILGIRYSPDGVYDSLTIGPSADSPEAKEFRSFWGEVCDVRRFEDGSISETVLWNDSTTAIKHTIPHQIMDHLMTRHFPSTGTLSSNIDGRLEGLSLNSSCADPEKCVDDVINSFTRLRRVLMCVKDLPLSIATVHCTSSILAHAEVPCYRMNTDVFKAVYNECHGFCEVIIQLESSNKWPLYIDPIRQMMTLFYIELSRVLSDREGLKCLPTQEFLDVAINGHVFRLRIHYPPLLQLMTSQAPSLYTDYHMSHVIKPQLISTLTRTQGEWPSFGLSVRLCKQWISTHLLSNHVPKEIIELMVANLYHNPDPFEVSNSSVVIFYRFLSLISSHDWSHDPLFINIDGLLSDDVIANVKHKYSTNRPEYPDMGVVSQFDHTSSMTHSKPESSVLSRLVSLAKSSLSFIADNVFTTDFKQIFKCSLKGFDAIIYLKDRLNDKRLPRHRTSRIFLSDFDPVAHYMSLLEENYSEYALFFVNDYSPDVICISWKPAIAEPQNFKTTNGYCLVKNKETYTMDKSTLLSDMAIMGDGLVLKVTETN